MEHPVPIIGSSPEILEVKRLIDLFAASSATVLINGETGTGKELVAQGLHRKSPRRNRAFVPVNCAAIPRDLLESELFGHRKGAFSGAIADRAGRFELAEGGTLFLDEVGDMPLDLQAKMLRVLQEGVIDPIGSSRPVRVDVRVVAATHRDVEAECAAGRFREDLLYRINVLPITVPSLRERAGDIAPLVTHLAARLCAKGALPLSLDEEFIGLLRSYSWPGNIRELSNLMQRLTVMYPGKRVRWQDVPVQMFPKKLREMLPHAPQAQVAGAFASRLPEATQPLVFFECAGLPNPVEEIVLIANGKRDFPSEGVFLKAQLADFERKIISHALNHAGGNVSKTAQLLNLQRTTLLQKLSKFKSRGDGLDVELLCAQPPATQ
jgi:sigma-54 specific flagellar transcriptional regulator A